VKLYTFFRSSAAFRVRIALNLKGLPYEGADIHLRRGDQSQPPYLGVNPQGLVPALEIGDERKALTSGCDAYVAKPVLLKKLLDLVHDFIGGGEALRPGLAR